MSLFFVVGLLLGPALGLERSNCANTRSGRLFLADSSGYVCPRGSFLSHTGCCDASDAASEKFSCDTCETELDGCCSSYEHCVTCCMHPDNHGDTDLSTKTRELFRDKVFEFDSTFAFCEAACRTTSSSTLHENEYISDRRYCYRFNQGGMKRAKTDDAFARLDGSRRGEGGARIVSGEENESCSDVCGRLNPPMACDDHQFSSHCDEMREHFPCEAGCFTHLDGVSPRVAVAETFPSYMQPAGQKPDWPAACFPDARASSSCDAKHPSARRLCLCAV